MRSPSLRGRLVHGLPLARHTTWRTGGVADRAYTPANLDDLRAFLAGLPASEPVVAIGLGSNLLVRDGGFRGTVLLLHGTLVRLELAPDGIILAEAGVSSPKVARFAALHDFAQAEFLAGIPGTVGGALAMNAGCWGGETWDFVRDVTVVDRAGGLHVRGRDRYLIGYRSVQAKPGVAASAFEIFVAARFAFPRGGGAAARARIRTLLERRIATQPLALPNAGSVFRNPPGDHAARLIEACGLKGFAIGGARVSELHANFIVNPGGRGSAADIERLMEHVRASVAARFGVELEPEVRVIGEAP